MDFYSSGQPLFLDSAAAAAKDTAIHEVCYQMFSTFCYNFEIISFSSLKGVPTVQQLNGHSIRYEHTSGVPEKYLLRWSTVCKHDL